MSNKKGEFICTHDACKSGNYMQRKSYPYSSSLTKHERKIEDHPCFSTDKNAIQCKTCLKRWLEMKYTTTLRTSKSAKSSLSIQCRHKGCMAVLNSIGHRNEHEKEVAHSGSACGLDCVACNNNKPPVSFVTTKEAQQTFPKATATAEMLSLTSKLISGQSVVLTEFNWEKELAIDPNLEEHLFVVKTTTEHSPGGVIPFKALETQWIAWWDEMTADLQPTSQLSEAVRATLRTYIFQFVKYLLLLVYLNQSGSKLIDIRWRTLLTSLREKQTTPLEQTKRVGEAKRLLEATFGCTYQEALKLLIDRDEITKYLIQESSVLKELVVPEITKEALLAFKDRNYISDNHWDDLVQTFHLSCM